MKKIKINWLQCFIAAGIAFVITMLYMSICVKSVTRELEKVQCENVQLREANSFKKKAIRHFFIYMDSAEELIDEMSNDTLINFMDSYSESDYYDTMVEARDSINSMIDDEC